MTHYIIIEVREHNTDAFTTDVARIRKAVHDLNLDEADVVIRSDRRTLIDGRPTRFAEIQALFNYFMNRHSATK